MNYRNIELRTLYIAQALGYDPMEYLDDWDRRKNKRIHEYFRDLAIKLEAIQDTSDNPSQAKYDQIT